MTTIVNHNLSVAETIRRQLGGHRFESMTGAKNFVGGGNFLKFSLPNKAAKDKINMVVVHLDSDDTYTIKFYSMRGLSLKLVSESCGVYWDQLRDVFTRATGLYTHL